MFDKARGTVLLRLGHRSTVPRCFSPWAFGLCVLLYYWISGQCVSLVEKLHGQCRLVVTVLHVERYPPELPVCTMEVFCEQYGLHRSSERYLVLSSVGRPLFRY